MMMSVMALMMQMQMQKAVDGGDVNVNINRMADQWVLLVLLRCTPCLVSLSGLGAEVLTCSMQVCER